MAYNFLDHTKTYLGDSTPCNCNGRSDVCDPRTGFCTNCTQV